MTQKPALKLPFTKMHGIGNDFVVIDDYLSRSTETPIGAALARKLCDRRFGVGADQILWLKPAQDAGRADFRMEILNADGSQAEMCGNGIRAVAVFVNDRTPRKKPEYRIETLGGIKTVQVSGHKVKVDMGAPGLGGGFPSAGEALEIAPGAVLKFFEVNMGNPHAVFFVETLEEPLPGHSMESLGERIEKHPRFPKRTNVEFVRVEGPNTLRVRVWERGAGITLACGTGACASAVASIATGRVKDRAAVILPGGTLQIAWAGAGKPVLMEGPATEVFQGVFVDRID